MVTDPLVRLDRASRAYPRTGVALRPVSFTLARREFAYVVGASGSGKSTLLRLVAMIDAPTEGIVEVAGFSSTTIRPREVPVLRRRLGVVFQDFRLLPDRTVEQNVAFALEVTGVPRQEVWARSAHRLAQVGLAARGRAFPHELSGGEQQRVAIARALVHDPVLLLADEPTGNLDPRAAAAVHQLLDEIHAQGTAVLMATHDVAQVRRAGRRLLLLREGALVHDGTAELAPRGELAVGQGGRR
ncbi:MAG: ATP-binding cassette domain-containing protein [Gemmatimonadetes bacterium]|nr:ATP-binding cassette domain-containing protein [Gemmatimonadota bacterium]